MRLVLTLPIGSGVVVCERSAAAAAAEESDVAEGEFLRKAEVAAIAAEELAGRAGICANVCQQSQSGVQVFRRMHTWLVELRRFEEKRGIV